MSGVVGKGTLFTISRPPLTKFPAAAIGEILLIPKGAAKTA